MSSTCCQEHIGLIVVIILIAGLMEDHQSLAIAYNNVTISQ